MFFDDDGSYPADEYGYYDQPHHHEFQRVTVAAADTPSVSRTFLTCQGVPHRWLIEAFLLATGQAETRREDLVGDHYNDPIPPSTFRPAFDPVFVADGPAPMSGYLFDAAGSGRIASGEPRVQILDDDADETAGRQWHSATAPLRREHVQQELTRRFGVVRPEFDTSGRREPSSEIGSPALESLLMALPPSRRLALRAHLVDSGLTGPITLDPVTASRLLAPMQWLVDRLGPDGVDQDERGAVPTRFADEAEAAMKWITVPHAPPSPGQALIDLARSSRFLRRFRGRVVPTARARNMAEKPLRALAELQSPAALPRHAFSVRPSAHGLTLARLAIADGSATTPVDVIEQIASGLQTMRSEVDDRPRSEEAQEAATHAVDELMAELAPLGGSGEYGVLNPPVQALARAQLFPERSRYGW